MIEDLPGLLDQDTKDRQAAATSKASDVGLFAALCMLEES
jgi:hypothetical protein